MLTQVSVGGVLKPFRLVTSSGKPSALNTGCRIARSSLTPITGASLQAATTGANPKRTWTEGYLITGVFNPQCTGFVLTDFILESSAPGTHASFSLLNDTIGGAAISYGTVNGLGDVTGGAIDTAVLLGPGSSLSYCNISGCQDGVHTAPGGTITRNYIHGNVGPTGAHADGLQIFDTINGMSITFNTIDVSDGVGAINSAIQLGHFPSSATVSGLSITDNWLNGGGYTLSGGFSDQTEVAISATNVTVARNLFGASYLYSSPVYSGGTQPISGYIGTTNVFEATGQPVTVGAVPAAGTVSSTVSATV